MLHTLHHLGGLGFNLHPTLSTTAQQTGRTNLQVIIIKDRLDVPLSHFHNNR